MHYQQVSTKLINRWAKSKIFVAVKKMATERASLSLFISAVEEEACIILRVKKKRQIVQVEE